MLVNFMLQSLFLRSWKFILISKLAFKIKTNYLDSTWKTRWPTDTQDLIGWQTQVETCLKDPRERKIERNSKLEGALKDNRS